jgi:hypothetical protein
LTDQQRRKSTTNQYSSFFSNAHTTVLHLFVQPLHLQTTWTLIFTANTKLENTYQTTISPNSLLVLIVILLSSLLCCFFFSSCEKCVQSQTALSSKPAAKSLTDQPDQFSANFTLGLLATSKRKLTNGIHYCSLRSVASNPFAALQMEFSNDPCVIPACPCRCLVTCDLRGLHNHESSTIHVHLSRPHQPFLDLMYSRRL